MEGLNANSKKLRISDTLGITMRSYISFNDYETAFVKSEKSEEKSPQEVPFLL